VKKIVLLLIVFAPAVLLAQKPDRKADKKTERKERIKLLQQRAAEGEIVFARQTVFGIKLNTDGYGGFLELGRMKTLKRASLYWLEFGERKHPKEEKLSRGYFSNPFIYGKVNNFYYARLGFAQQIMLGQKGNKNGVAISAIYGGGISVGFLKPYYIEIEDPNTGAIYDIKYGTDAQKDSFFLDPTVINGGSGFGKGFKELKFVPGFNIRTALRFDYGRFNELVSALEVGLNAEYYTQTMPIMLLNKEKRFFFNAYVSLVFGKRK
jgi:hypothetical protein